MLKRKYPEIPPPMISPNGKHIKTVKCSDKRTPVQASSQAEYDRYGDGFGVSRPERDYKLKTDKPTPVRASTQAKSDTNGEDFGMMIERVYRLETG